MESRFEMPSGCEVESATLHVPVGEELVVAHPHEHRSGMRGKIDALKSRGMAKVHDVQRTLSDRSATMKRTLASKQVEVKDALSARQTQMKSSMATSPMKWAGIAAGSGFALGLVGRYLHWKNRHRSTMDIVVIDAMC